MTTLTRHANSETVPLGFGGVTASVGDHIAHFYRCSSQMFNVLGPYVAEILGFRFSGFFAWWIWRTIYLLKLPGLERKVRVAMDWTLDLFFPRDIVLLKVFMKKTSSEIPTDSSENW